MGTRHWPEDADNEVERLEGIITTLRQRVQELEKELAAKTHKVSIPTNTMEQWVASEIRRVANPLKEQITKLTAERDELLAELEWCASSLNPHNERTKRVFDAIASVKEKQNAD